MSHFAKQMHQIGDVRVSHVIEQLTLLFSPTFLFPAWDASLLEKHRRWVIPEHYNEAEAKIVISIHTWVVRTKRHTILIDSCAGNHTHRPLSPQFDQLNLPFLDRPQDAGVAPEAVDYVLCTHRHLDHVGWNTLLQDGRWVPTFPNAKSVFSKAGLYGRHHSRHGVLVTITSGPGSTNAAAARPCTGLLPPGLGAPPSLPGAHFWTRAGEIPILLPGGHSSPAV